MMQQCLQVGSVLLLASLAIFVGFQLPAPSPPTAQTAVQRATQEYDAVNQAYLRAVQRQRASEVTQPPRHENADDRIIRICMRESGMLPTGAIRPHEMTMFIECIDRHLGR